MNSLEFRAWDGRKQRMLEVTSLDWFNGRVVKMNKLWDVKQDEVTLLQWTGLKDKNGVKIFDKDIVRCHKFTEEMGANMGVVEGEKEFVARVEFSVYGGTQVVLPNDNFMFVWEYDEGWHEESLEVIGNIYENPELINDKK